MTLFSTQREPAYNAVPALEPALSIRSSHIGMSREPYSDDVHLGPWPHGESTQRLVAITSLSVQEQSHHGERDPKEPLGIPRRKPRTDRLDLLALALATSCSVLAIVAVAHNSVAWHLRRTNQLIVSGFLLSIMNLCLGRVIPRICVLLEARYGRSKLQNYDGILRNQAFGTRLSLVWRVVLLCSTALPIGLSVAYKTSFFQLGGSSSLYINATKVTDLPPDYGAFNMPDLVDDGLAIYFNATLPYRAAIPDSASAAAPSHQPYGANMLVLGPHTSAMLDLQRSARLSKLQRSDSLSIGDSLEVHADVRGTVATKRTDIEASRDPDFHQACADTDNMVLTPGQMPTGWSVQILAASHTGDQSRIWLGFVLNNETGDCNKFAPQAHRFDIKRRNCHGMWTITRAGIELSAGSCDEDNLPTLEQYVYTSNTFFLGALFIQVLQRGIGDFATSRNASSWKDSALATASAAMLWSALVLVDGADHLTDKTGDSPNGQSTWGNGHTTMKDNGMLYSAQETVIAIRPTLRRSWLLYLVFAIQPILMALIMIATTLLYSVPLDKGFGMISILAGVDRTQLDMLYGATLSGELKDDVQLVISPTREVDGKDNIEYQLVSTQHRVARRTLNASMKYW